MKKALITLILFSLTFSHTFVPYDFELNCPNDITVTIGKEVEFKVSIKNIGMNDDKYNVTVTTTPNIVVRPTHSETQQISSNQVVSLSFVLLPLSGLGEKTVTISVRSIYSYRPEQGIDITKQCVFNVNVNYIKLGNDRNNLYLFSLFFFILLLIFLLFVKVLR